VQDWRDPAAFFTSERFLKNVAACRELARANKREAGFLVWTDRKTIHVNRPAIGDPESIYRHIINVHQYPKNTGFYEGTGAEILADVHIHPLRRKYASVNTMPSVPDLCISHAQRVENNTMGSEHTWLNPVSIIGNMGRDEFFVFQWPAHSNPALNAEDQIARAWGKIFKRCYPGKQARIIPGLAIMAYAALPDFISRYPNRRLELLRLMEIRFGQCRMSQLGQVLSKFEVLVGDPDEDDKDDEDVDIEDGDDEYF
jgi:hypothetical protein